MSAWAVKPLALPVVPEHPVIVGTTGTGVHGFASHGKACDRLGPFPVPAGVLVGRDRDSPATPLPADGDAFWFRGLTLGQPQL
jgi:hypothetical protein